MQKEDKLTAEFTEKYEDAFADKLVEMSNKGLSLRAFAASINATHDTVYKWQDKHPKFRDAMNLAKMKRALFYEVTALSNLGKKDFNTTLFNKLMQTVSAEEEKEERLERNKRLGKK